MKTGQRNLLARAIFINLASQAVETAAADAFDAADLFAAELARREKESDPKKAPAPAGSGLCDCLAPLRYVDGRFVCQAGNCNANQPSTWS